MTLETPRYVQILDVLSRRLANGEYPVEMRMPTERELCDEFGASRFTVREALRRLVEQGMLTRRQGAGIEAVGPGHWPEARLQQRVEVGVLPRLGARPGRAGRLAGRAEPGGRGGDAGRGEDASRVTVRHRRNGRDG